VTYCVGIKVRDGLIGLADGRVTSGKQVSIARKLTLHGPDDPKFMVMTSGLRSVRDKTLAYLERELAGDPGRLSGSMLDVLELYCQVLRRVRAEDADALEAGDLTFNLHTLIGGQMPTDTEPLLFLVYPEGNWIECEERTPYLSIGATAYGKPILDRALRYDSDLRSALKIAYLSFDSTRYSSADVGYPLDLASFALADRQWRMSQLDYDDLNEQRQWWNRAITDLARNLPDGAWAQSLAPDFLDRIR
jgi:putative proteasome-type protease